MKARLNEYLIVFSALNSDLKSVDLPLNDLDSNFGEKLCKAKLTK